MLTVKDFTDCQKDFGLSSDELLYVIRTYQFPKGYKPSPEELLPHKDVRTAYRVKNKLQKKGFLTVHKNGKETEVLFTNMIRKVYEKKGVTLSETDLENEHNSLFSNMNFNNVGNEITSEVWNVLNDINTFLLEFANKHSDFFSSANTDGMKWLLEIGKKKLQFATPVRLKEILRILSTLPEIQKLFKD
jgi:hypothetical protein